MLFPLSLITAGYFGIWTVLHLLHFLLLLTVCLKYSDLDDHAHDSNLCYCCSEE